MHGASFFSSEVDVDICLRVAAERLAESERHYYNCLLSLSIGAWIVQVMKKTGDVMWMCIDLRNGLSMSEARKVLYCHLGRRATADETCAVVHAPVGARKRSWISSTGAKGGIPVAAAERIYNTPF